MDTATLDSPMELVIFCLLRERPKASFSLMAHVLFSKVVSPRVRFSFDDELKFSALPDFVDSFDLGHGSGTVSSVHHFTPSRAKPNRRRPVAAH